MLLGALNVGMLGASDTTARGSGAGCGSHSASGSSSTVGTLGTLNFGGALLELLVELDALEHTVGPRLGWVALEEWEPDISGMSICSSSS